MKNWFYSKWVAKHAFKCATLRMLRHTMLWRAVSHCACAAPNEQLAARCCWRCSPLF